MSNKKIELLANQIRIDIIEMLNKAGSGHSGGALGMTDLFAVLYSRFLKHNPKKPNDKNRDFVILSNGHTCPVLYATLSNFNYFSKSHLSTLRSLKSLLQGHPHFLMGKNETPVSLAGITNSGGPLGQGISQAVGLAASLKRDNKSNKIYCFMGDGEIEEGQVWEAFLFTSKEKLNNLIVIIDRNHIQIDGNTENVSQLEPLSKKLSAFNFKVIEFNGNDINQIITAFNHANESKTKPVCLIANTIPGKGVSFMENKFEWHGRVPNDDETQMVLKELYEERKNIK